MHAFASRILARCRRGWIDLKDVRGRPVDQARSRFLEVPFPFAGEWRERHTYPSCALVCHAYHPQVFDLIRTAVSRLPSASDLLFTTDSSDKASELSALFSDWPADKIVVRVVPNIGRDLPSKLIAFRDRLERYDVVLFLHTKHTTHKAKGESWRDYLFHNLAGSQGIVNSILTIFESSPEVGIVFPAHWKSVVPWIRWIGNYDLGRALASRMGVPIGFRTAIDFPSGSMFWSRPEALRPLLDLELTYDDLPREPVGSDGTLLHAIERVLLYACESAGFTWVKVCDVGHEPGAGIPLRVSSRHDLVTEIGATARLLPKP